MAAWNATDAEFPQACAHRLFEQPRRARPARGRAAFRRPAELSYDELNRRANRLAHYLRRLGLASGPGGGLSVERGRPELVIGAARRS